MARRRNKAREGAPSEALYKPSASCRTLSARAAKAATTTIPVVFTCPGCGQHRHSPGDQIGGERWQAADLTLVYAIAAKRSKFGDK
jgi:hypothetical protein